MFQLGTRSFFLGLNENKMNGIYGRGHQREVCLDAHKRLNEETKPPEVQVRGQENEQSLELAL